MIGRYYNVSKKQDLIHYIDTELKGKTHFLKTTELLVSYDIPNEREWFVRNEDLLEILESFNDYLVGYVDSELIQIISWEKIERDEQYIGY